MSNDLISRSKVIKIIEEEMEKKLSYEVHNAQIDIMFKVKELPTAYDVDMVVEQITILQDNAEYESLNTFEEKAAYNTAYFKAIEIVKSGGIE